MHDYRVQDDPDLRCTRIVDDGADVGYALDQLAISFIDLRAAALR